MDVGKAIEHARVAGNLRAVARENRQAAPGLLKAAALHSAKVSMWLSKGGDSLIRQEGESPFTPGHFRGGDRPGA